MRIGIQIWGSRGDIRPLLALAEGLQSSGHAVTLLITCIESADFNASLSNSGVKIKNVASPVIRDKEELAKIGKDIFAESNPVKQIKTVIEKFFVPAEAEMYQAAEKLCLDNDLVIGHFFHYPLRTAAELIGRPYVSVMLVHSAVPSSLQPPIGFPNLGNLGNRIAWWALKLVLNKSLKKYPDRLRKAHGLRPTNDFVGSVLASHQLTLVAVSPEICQRKKDWPDYYQVCGFLDAPELSIDGQLSEGLEEFLSYGEAPVYMTFGSVMQTDIPSQREAVTLLSDAAKMANCRAIIQAPLWQECGFSSTEAVYYVHPAPHKIVFPHCKLIVHHGGAGTTQAAILAGKPSIVVAHIAEQEFWGRELSRIGLAPGLLLRRKVTAEQLAKSIRSVVSSGDMAEKAMKIGAAMNKEDGVGVAVRLINEKFNAKEDG
jgi:sterol 3beta-glucosyltransferase